MNYALIDFTWLIPTHTWSKVISDASKREYTISGYKSKEMSLQWLPTQTSLWPFRLLDSITISEKLDILDAMVLFYSIHSYTDIDTLNYTSLPFSLFLQLSSPCVMSHAVFKTIPFNMGTHLLQMTQLIWSPDNFLLPNREIVDSWRG